MQQHDESESVIRQIGEMLEQHEHITILSHVRPDGDAIGSQIALGFTLREMGKQIRIINDDGLPSNLAFMEGSELVEKADGESIKTDLVVAVDCANKPRLGERSLASVANCTQWINIDHHRTNPKYGNLNWIDPSSPATGQMIYQLLRTLNYPIPAESRDAMYVAISTDTGSFQYASTTAKTYEIIADLVRRGVRVGELNSLIYDSYPMRRIELMRALLNTLEIHAKGRLATWKLSRKTADELNVRPEDSEGLIDMIRAIDGVLVAAFFEEIEAGKIRISLRSKEPKVDVCEVATQFGGGGHTMAAGIRMEGSLEEVREQVLQAIEKIIITAGF